jgi:tRNA A37 N6-isopentenylltransferase MiaA
MSDYCFRQNPGIEIGNLTPQIVGETLADIEDRHGIIDPHTVVDESRPEDAALHPVFEWCDEIAAEKWRVEQARRVVRSVEVVIEPQYGSTQIAYVNIQSQGGYMSAATVSSRPDLYQEALQSYRSRMEAASVQLIKMENLAPTARKKNIEKARKLMESAAALVTA